MRKLLLRPFELSVPTCTSLVEPVTTVDPTLKVTDSAMAPAVILRMAQPPVATELSPCTTTVPHETVEPPKNCGWATVFPEP